MCNERTFAEQDERVRGLGDLTRIRTTALLCAAAAALLVSCSSASGGASSASWDREHAVVQISFEAVKPETVRISADGDVTWVNEAQETRGFVVFPTSISTQAGCAKLSPTYTKTAKGYRSLPIGEDTGQVQLPCPLAPGSYDYEVWLVGSGLGSEVGGAGEPQRILRAKIVVE